jgi:hypothetical protein
MRGLQRATLWVLEHGYDLIPVKEKRGAFSSHKRLSMKDFERKATEDTVSVLGIRRSPRRFAVSSLTLITTVLLATRWVSQSDAFREIHGNEVLSTIVYVSIFIVLDQAVPFLLRALCCVISRIHPWLLHRASWVSF